MKRFDDMYNVLFALMSAVLIFLCIYGSASAMAKDSGPAEKGSGIADVTERWWYEERVETAPELEEVPEEDTAVEYDTDDYVLRVLTQECGNDREIALAVTQCMANGCADTGLTPAQLIDKYQYTFPASWVSDAVLEAWQQIMVDGIPYEPAGDADVFYSTASDFYSAWHESQEFVVQIGCVRFFRMG